MHEILEELERSNESIEGLRKHTFSPAIFTLRVFENLLKRDIELDELFEMLLHYYSTYSDTNATSTLMDALHHSDVSIYITAFNKYVFCLNCREINPERIPKFKFTIEEARKTSLLNLVPDQVLEAATNELRDAINFTILAEERDRSRVIGKINNARSQLQLECP